MEGLDDRVQPIYLSKLLINSILAPWLLDFFPAVLVVSAFFLQHWQRMVLFEPIFPIE